MSFGISNRKTEDGISEDLFGSLKSELSCLRQELNEEIEKVKSTVNDMETSLNATWDTIKDLQDELKIHAKFRKKHKESLYIVSSKVKLSGVPSFPDSSIFLFQGMFSLSRLNFTFFCFCL